MSLNNTLFPPIVDQNPAPFVYGESGNHLTFEYPIGNYNDYGIGFKIISPYGDKLFEDVNNGTDSNYLKSPNGNKIELSLIQSIVTEEYIHNQCYKIQLRFRKDTDYSPWSSTILIRFIDKPMLSSKANLNKIEGYFYFEDTQEEEGFSSYQIEILENRTQIHKSSLKNINSNDYNFSYNIPIDLLGKSNLTYKITCVTTGGYKAYFAQNTMVINSRSYAEIDSIVSAKSYPDLGGIMVKVNPVSEGVWIKGRAEDEKLVTTTKFIFDQYYSLPAKVKFSACSFDKKDGTEVGIISLPDDEKNKELPIKILNLDENGGNFSITYKVQIKILFSTYEENVTQIGSFIRNKDCLQIVLDVITIGKTNYSTHWSVSTTEWYFPNKGSNYKEQQEQTILRADHRSNFNKWEVLGKVTLEDKPVTWLDTTVDSSLWYKYRVIMEDVDSSLLCVETSSPVILNLETTFLADEDTQFPVMLNEDVSGFKFVVSESVTNTLGSKFPFIRRNANTKYRQFNLGGMISFMADEEYNAIDAYGGDSISENEDMYPGPIESTDGNSGIILFKNALFLTKQDAFQSAIYNYNTYCNVNGIEDFEDILFEKIFRERAMEFLTNGKPKLFRSATEGNILITLTNVSFTPNKQLGRKIYSFSATATEIDECSIESYKKYHILKDQEQLVNPYILALYGETIDGETMTVASESVSEAGKAIVFFQIDDLEV